MGSKAAESVMHERTPPLLGELLHDVHNLHAVKVPA